MGGFRQAQATDRWTGRASDGMVAFDRLRQRSRNDGIEQRAAERRADVQALVDSPNCSGGLEPPYLFR